MSFVKMPNLPFTNGRFLWKKSGHIRFIIGRGCATVSLRGPKGQSNLKRR